MAETGTSSHTDHRKAGRSSDSKRVAPSRSALASAERPRSDGKRRRAAHLGPERRRPEVLDAALELFLEHGYDGTSMQAVADQAGVTKPVVYACYSSKDSLFRALLAREEARILTEIQTAFEGAELSDPESTLIEGYTGFLRAVASSPDVYRLIFLGEGGGNAAVARRIQRGREAQIDALTVLARGWLELREGRGGGQSPEATARLLGYAIAALAESGARLLLSESAEWTPETLGRELGRLAAAAQTAV
ncbi:MAG: TetR/AcrR family transcriptional regulator [Solirubrobacterales bacterium]